MRLNRNDLADFVYFLAIARHGSFRKAALELGVTPSALSHAITGLEARQGVRLLNRTTRSVSLTDAGADLRASIEGPFLAIDEAAENLNRFREAPTGRVRINVLEDAVSLLLDPVLPKFVERYPDVHVDLSVSNRMLDVIAGGFDAGIRYGGTVPEDMIARRLGPDMRWLAAASPHYISRFGMPEHPRDLVSHRCIGIRLGNGEMYRWEFERGDEAIEIAAPGPVSVDASAAALTCALSSIGVMYGAEPVLRPYIDAGALTVVCPQWSSMGSGFHAYYSGRRQVPTALRLLIDLICEMRPLGAGQPA